MMIQKAIHRVRCLENMGQIYLYQRLRHLGQYRHLATLFTGATIKHLSREEFAKGMIVVPLTPLLNMFGDASNPLEGQIHKLYLQIQYLRRTRDLLLPSLLSGQIDVEFIDNA